MSTDAIISLRDRLTGTVVSATPAMWGDPNGHAALLSMALDLQRLSGGTLLLTGTRTEGEIRVVGPEIDGRHEQLMHFHWNSIDASCDIAPERIADAGHRRG